jgi:hypothetical protein
MSGFSRALEWTIQAEYNLELQNDLHYSWGRKETREI